ncbi:ATP-binding protein [Ruegeria sp. ANG-R]|uniref:sensor histidine kinase n=1 Tax=Ruegeria sp. ANG-R TaxID=1577903 RepID=UPI0006904C72|nr:ATP-binding protein [Ruegeria sp. ANG-R]
MRWNDLTLRTQVMSIVLISWAIVGVFSVVTDLVQIRSSRAEEIRNRGDAFLAQVVSTLAHLPPDSRAEAALGFFPAEWSVRVGTRDAATALVHGRQRPNMAEWLAARLEHRGIAVAELSVAETVIDARHDQSALLQLFNSHAGEPLDAESVDAFLVNVFSVRLKDDEEWLNCYLLMQNKSIAPLVIVGSIDSLVALTLLCILAFLIQKVMRPLSAMAVNAELIGRGEEVGPLIETGAIDIRHTIIAFNRMEARIVLALEYKTTLLRSLGHDLKGPIARMQDAIEKLEPTAPKEQLLNRLDTLSEIVNSVTDLNRETHHDGDLVRLDLRSLIEALVEEQVDAGRDVTYTIEQSSIVNGRHNALTRVLRNLLENAVKYGGRTSVTLTRVDDMAAIHIDDEGPGIPAEQLETAFEPFQRLGAEGPGSGLGLAIVRTIVVDQGGTVSLENRAGGGLRASVFLPIDKHN